MIGLAGTSSLTQAVAGQAAGLALNQQAFRNELQNAGAVLTPVSFGRLEALESMADGHAFFDVARDVRREAGFSSGHAALWRVDFANSRVSAPQREACSLWASLEIRGYYPTTLRSLLGTDAGGETKGAWLEEPMLALAAASAIRPSKFRLVPRHRMPSLPELSGLLGEESWPVYSGRDDVRIHGYRSSAYGAGVHDLRHYISWKHWSEEDRKDSILLYRALRGVLSTTLPSLGSLAGRIGARLFYGDGFFHREMTALDECLSGPPGTGNGIFPQVSLANVAANLDGDKSRFHMAVEKAFAGNPREQAWRQALELVKTNGAAA